MEAGDERYLKALIAQGEHRQLDFKFEISDARKIARTLSAFSNTEGGRLLIGVKDNGRISGIRSDEEFYMVEAAASLYCKPEIRFDTHQRQAEGKNVLEVYIPEAKRKPVYARDESDRWMAWVRVDDENILASVIHLRIWNEEHKSRGRLLEFTRREQILLASLKQYPGTDLQGLQHETGFRKNELVNMLTRLILFDVIRMEYRGGTGTFLLQERPGES
jgi:hypothetical protein